MSKLNPVEKDVLRVEPSLETDKITAEQDKAIATIVTDDYCVGINAGKAWVAQKEKDLQHYDAIKPSIIENLTKKEWQSDRNLGICPAIVDTYQATLLATCWNPDTIHFVANESNDYNTKENLQRFTKWAVSKNEGNVFPEVDDFIHNRVTLGFSAFKIYWKVWYEWVDTRMPKKDGGYRIKTEEKRFEKGIMKNVDDVDDLIFPDYGKTLQDQPFLIEILHLNSETFQEKVDRGIFKKVPDRFVETIKTSRLQESNKLRKMKADQLGLRELQDLDARVFPIDLLAWYGTYKKGKRTEKYRFIVEPYTETVLSIKPLRKITRSGKIPFVGGALIRRPGKVRGKSIPTLIAPSVNAINNTFNQKTDFQFVENCPYGFHKVTEEGYSKQTYELIPGTSYPTGDEDPNKAVFFPNRSRSMAWAIQDIQLLFEVIERQTGAASYFMSNQKGVSGTATRDVIINEKSETKFSLWVKRIQEDISEAITMFVNMYQDWAPPKLGERVLGKDGQKLFPNLSVKTLRGNYDARMTPDITSGSKTFERQAQMWAFENLQNTMWAHPQVNPKGNYNLVADTAKKVMGIDNVEKYLGQEPKGVDGQGQDIEDEWSRFLQGDVFDPPEGATGIAYQHLVGHMKQKEEKLQDLDEEYRPNFMDHLFKTAINVQKLMKEIQAEKIANQLASEGVNQLGNQGPGQPGQPGQPQPAAPGAPGARPPGSPVAIPGAENPIPGPQPTGAGAGAGL